MKIAFSLFKIWFSGVFSFGSDGNGSSIDKTKKAKKAGRTIGFVALAIYVIAVFGGMFTYVLYTLYATLKPLGMQSMTLAMTAFSAIIVTFFFGFINASGTYVTNSAEEFLLSMPIKPREMFAAKFMLTYVLEFVLAFAITCIGTIVYGAGEGLLTNPMLYVAMLMAGVTLPLIPVTLTYIILVIIFNCGKAVINKRILTVISTVLMIVIILGFNFIYQRMMKGINNPEMLMNLTTSEGFQSVLNVTKFFPPTQWFLKSVTALSAGSAFGVLKSIGWILLLFGSSVIVAILAVVLLAPFYIRSIIGFSETQTKKLAAGTSGDYIKTDMKSVPLFRTLLKRDILCVLREPTFFVNGPLLVFLMPIIFAFSIAVALPEDAIEKLTSVLNGMSKSKEVITAEMQQMILYIVSGAGSLIVVLLGTMTSLSATAFSREGKVLFILKAMPIPMKTLAAVKMVHSLIYVIISLVMTLALVIAFFVIAPIQFTVMQIAGTIILFIILSLLLSFSVLLIDQVIDTSHPKLNWENPQVAFKQNLNTLAGVFLSMGIVVILVILGILLLPKRLLSLVCVCFVLLACNVLFWKLYCRYAEKKLATIE